MADLSLEDIQKIKKETPIRIAKNIREVREAKGLTQIELANKIGSDRQYLYKIEAAKVSVTIAKLAIIAKALDVSLKDLV
ncbi:MAG: helix-turn-helix transcriptional regulator [Flavobacteriales bacterium]|nr:helix-turn-helix transcriptional regulator [Flavobacteriales bacterium]MBX2958740.1 helix-turn-helix transcriptional regulator [Flavobacteriales bacterium]